MWPLFSLVTITWQLSHKIRLCAPHLSTISPVYQSGTPPISSDVKLLFWDCVIGLSHPLSLG